MIALAGGWHGRFPCVTLLFVGVVVVGGTAVTKNVTCNSFRVTFRSDDVTICVLYETLKQYVQLN